MRSRFIPSRRPAPITGLIRRRRSRRRRAALAMVGAAVAARRGAKIARSLARRMGS